MSAGATPSRLASMLNKRLFVVLRELEDAAGLATLLDAHLDWAVQVERQGYLFASGPFVTDDGPAGTAGGMSILRAASLEEAEAVLARDPFISEGVFSITIKEWVVMEGGVTLTVRFSDQTANLL